MGVYFGETEITNMDNLVPQAGQDITQAFFGSTEVFTVWGEYDGALPAQYTANGDHLADYRIYGASGGVGDRTPSIFDSTKYQTITNNQKYNCTVMADDAGITLSATGTDPYVGQVLSAGVNASSLNNIFMPCKAETTYTISANKLPKCYVTYVNESGISVGFNTVTANVTNFTFTTKAGTAYLLFRIGDGNAVAGDTIRIDAIAVTEGATPIPYGYEVDMSVSDGTTSTTTPIYIGSDPLGEDEYIDYASGKIYRWSNNQLSAPEVREKTNEEVTCTVSNDGVYTLTVSDTVQSDRILSFSYNPVEIPNGKTWVLAASAENIPSNNGTVTLGDEIHPVITVNIQNNGYNTTRPFGPSGTTYILDRMAITVRAGTPAGTFTLRPMLMYMEPTDPPVPLPALPTVDGTNIVDYAGQSAAVPSRFVAKYRKQNF